eukprot:8525367-Pyramimonas_sp.AAC.1
MTCSPPWRPFGPSRTPRRQRLKQRMTKERRTRVNQSLDSGGGGLYKWIKEPQGWAPDLKGPTEGPAGPVDTVKQL